LEESGEVYHEGSVREQQWARTVGGVVPETYSLPLFLSLK
jgi:hypothetical protein